MVRWLSRKTDQYGDDSQWVTPVPISNTEVKPLNADDSVKAKIGSRQTKQETPYLKKIWGIFYVIFEFALTNKMIRKIHVFSVG